MPEPSPQSTGVAGGRLALCDHDRCPWKHAAPIHDPGAADRAAERHTSERGHTVSFYRYRAVGSSDA